MTPSDGTIRIPGYSHRLSTAIRPVSAAEVVGPNTGEKSRATEANSLMRKFSELCSRRTYRRFRPQRCDNYIVGQAEAASENKLLSEIFGWCGRLAMNTQHPAQ